jgi:hypothetical protein
LRPADVAVFAAILNSHVLKLASPRNVSRAPSAFTKVSWAASAAASGSPSTRYVTSYTAR